MFELLILKSTTYAAKAGGGLISGYNQVDLLAEGAIAVFTDKGEMVTTANASTIFENREGFYFAVGQNGTTNLGSTISQVIPRTSVRYTRREYAVAVKQVVVVGEGADASGDLNFGTLVAGTYVRFRIFDTTHAVLPNDKVERYEYKVPTGATESSVIEAIGALINATSTLAVATFQGASGSCVGMYLTATNYYTTMEVLGDDVALESTIDYTTTARGGVPMSFGVGMGTQVAALEEEYNVELGKSNKTHLTSRYYTFVNMTDPAGTYDMYNFQWQQKRQGAIKEAGTVIKELVIAMPDGATQQSNFATIMLAALVGETAIFNGIES